MVDQLPKSLGGGERIALKIAASLPEYGYRASLLTLGAHPESPALRNPPCPIYLLPLSRTYDLTAMRGALSLGRFLRSQQVRIVQTFFESSDLWVGPVAKALSDAKLIWSRRDMGILRGRKHEMAYRMMNRVPDAVFAVSGQVRGHAIDVDGIEPDRVRTIYNGLELEGWQMREPGAVAGREIVIATVGNIRRVKGHDILIRAAREILDKFPDIVFSIAGEVLEQDYFDQLQQLARELGVEDRVRFTGGITDLRAYLSTADIFVLPSRSEGFSNAIIEAMAASLPVVATDVGGNAEAVRHGRNGLIVPPESPGALAAAIAALLSDPGKAAAMGVAGRAIVEEEFTTNAMMHRITAAYSRLLAEG
ncbi:MAG TPA: glycosyltransferase [Acidobacteriaceae bacterium]|nr:glycosyltransferase [Acidobacteriaceae bacterium]